MGLTKGDKSFWTSIPFVIIVVVATIGIFFFPIIETQICTPTGECSETTILKSLYEIYFVTES